MIKNINKTKFQFNNSRRGTSITGVLVATALLSVLAVGVGKMMESGQKGSLAVNNRVSMLNAISWVQLLSTQADRCAGAFQNSSNQPIIYDQTSKSLHKIQIGTSKGLEVGDNLGGVEVIEMFIEPLFGSEGALVSEANHAVAIRIKAKIANKAYGAQAFEEKVPLSIETNSLGQITGCRAVNEFSKKDMCEKLGFPYDDESETCGGFGNSCEEGEVMVGIELDGNPRCEEIAATHGNDGNDGNDAPPAGKKVFHVFYQWHETHNITTGNAKPCKAQGKCPVTKIDTVYNATSIQERCKGTGPHRPINSLPGCPEGTKPWASRPIVSCQFPDKEFPKREAAGDNIKGVVRGLNANGTSTAKTVYSEKLKGKAAKRIRICIEE